MTVRELRDLLNKCLDVGIDGNVVCYDDDGAHELFDNGSGTEAWAGDAGYSHNDLILHIANAW